MSRTHAFLFVVLVGGHAALAAEPSKEAVRKIAKGMSEAFLAEDWAKIVDHTYPALIKEYGGRKKAIETIGATVKALKEKGYVMTKHEIGELGDFHTEGENTFVIVPTTSETKAPVGTIRVQSFLLGVSPDRGKSWTFADGAGIQAKEIREKLLPKLPETLKLPEKAKPEVIKPENTKDAKTSESPK